MDSRFRYEVSHVVMNCRDPQESLRTLRALGACREHGEAGETSTCCCVYLSDFPILYHCLLGPIVMISSPIVQIWFPRADLGSAYVLAPQSPGLPQTEEMFIGVSWLILKLREVSSLSMGTIYSFHKRSSDQTYVNKHKQT